MLVREYRECDLAALRAIHAAQGFDYSFPDLRNPLFVTKMVLESESASQERDLAHSRVASPESRVTADEAGYGENAAPDRVGNCGAEQPPAYSGILGAVLLRLTAEAYLLLDPRAGTPRERWQWLLALQAAAERDAWLRGLEDVHAWLPPRIAAKFGKRITRLGWHRDDAWTPYCKHLFQ